LLSVGLLVVGPEAQPPRGKCACPITADAIARIGITMSGTMVAVPIADTVQMRRVLEFAGDATELADRRCDVELRDLIDRLHADLLELKDEGR
jgi:hypothetical protein